MAYTINGKVFTDHPLMDEIAHNCKLILDHIVIKNELLANDYEDGLYYTDVEARKMIVNNTINFDVFPFTIEILKAYGYDDYLARAILNNRDNVPASDKEKLLSFACDYFMEHYEEKNKYYRMLIGLPEYGTDEYNIYVSTSDFPKGYELDTNIDLSRTPIHELSNDMINILQVNGKIDELVKSHRGFNYSYLRYLGDNKVDLDTARAAGKFDILYMPSVENLVEDRFKELYNINKEIYLKRTYSEAYAYYSDYYDEIIILMILSQTFNDMIVDTPEWYIRRDIFDIRSVQYFLESYGVEFFKEIPLKYQIRIVKNLNKLIKYKSSNKNFDDILEIFGSKDTSIFKYYLFKRRNRNATSEDDKYTLEFVKAKIGESYDNYIKDEKYRSSYDSITYEDKYWDGDDTHEVNRNKHLNLDFTIKGTKFMSIEYFVSLADYLFQMEYFLGLLLDSNIDTGDIRINVPSIDSNIKFKLSNLFIFIYLLTLRYDSCSTNLFLPEEKELSDDNKPEFKKYDDYNGGYSYTPEELYDSLYSVDGKNGNGYLAADGGSSVFYSEIRSQEQYYDWMKRQYPEMFVRYGIRQYRFNSKVDIKALTELLARRHSKFQFEHGFTLADLKVDTFIKPEKISTIDELVSIYNTNKECYDNLVDLMTNKRPERDYYRILSYTFKELFTAPFDYDFYKISSNGKFVVPETFEKILQKRDYILYNFFIKLNSETNAETRRDNIRSVLNDVITTLEYYLSRDGLDYIFAFTSINSFDAIVKYIYLMINFFKSYKVYFLDPYVTYDISGDGKNKLENNAYAHDTIAEKEIQYLKWDKELSADNMSVGTEHEFEDNQRAQTKEVLDVYGHFDPDPDDDYDYDGKYAGTNEAFKDADGGYASDKSCIPFIMLNGGDSSGGVINLWDLNGANAQEMQEYYEVDGGYALDPDKYIPGKNSPFNYIIDGGSAGTNQFITKSMHTRIVDNQIKSEVRISNNEYNTLVVKEDGLYLQQLWASWYDFNELESDSEDMFAYFTRSYNNLYNVVQIAGDPDRLDDEINNGIEDILFSARETVKFYDSRISFESDFKSKVDSDIQQLYNQFYNYSPFAWEEF